MSNEKTQANVFSEKKEGKERIRVVGDQHIISHM